MKSLFFRLYLLLIVTIAGLGWGIDQLIENYQEKRQLTTDVDIHQGAFFLLNRALKRLPEKNHAQYVQAIAPSFGFPITLVSLDDKTRLTQLMASALSTEQHHYLQQGGIVTYYNDFDGTSWFIKKLVDSKQAMVFGPILIESSTKANTFIYVAFLTGLAVIVFVWVWPLSRGLGRLAKATEHFGQGEFSVRIQQDLPAPVNQLAARFNSMADRIERLLKSHKDLSHAVSHELRTPIARIRFAMEMVREIDEKTSQHKYLDTMDNNIEELDGLVDELLSYARFDREEPQLTFSATNITELLQQVLDNFILTETALSFTLSSQHQSVISDCDPEAIARVVDNLVRNAVRYAQQHIELTITKQQQYIVITVEDDGPGVPEEYWQTLFEPFVRLDKSRDRKSGGIGLGLAIVKRFIGLHGGEVTISKSAKLGGACFTLTLPDNITA